MVKNMFKWFKSIFELSESKRRIKNLEEVVRARKQDPHVYKFDETLLVAQYNLASEYVSRNKNKAINYLNNAIHEFRSLVREENKKLEIMSLKSKFYDEDFFYEREIMMDKIKRYEKTLLDVAQKIESNAEVYVRNIVFATNNLKTQSLDFDVEKSIKEEKIYDLENITRETKHEGKIRYVHNNSIIDKKMIYLYSYFLKINIGLKIFFSKV
jgi:hypothetical protein